MVLVLLKQFDNLLNLFKENVEKMLPRQSNLQQQQNEVKKLVEKRGANKPSRQEPNEEEIVQLPPGEEEEVAAPENVHKLILAQLNNSSNVMLQQITANQETTKQILETQQEMLKAQQEIIKAQQEENTKILKAQQDSNL